MKIPESIDARWIATLANEQLVTAEAQLHTIFRKHETAEKARSGARYMLLQGPPPLLDAWHRWSMVSNETRTRNLVIRRKR
jgi:hypothetical protein